MRKKILNTKNIAFAICFLDTLSFSILIPLLPHLQEKIHLTPSQLSFGVFLHGIIAFLVTPTLGKLADNFGKKNVLLWSIVGNAIGYMLILPYNYTLFLLSRIIGGASTANYGLSQGILSDLAKDENERKKSFSTLALMSGIGFIAGSLLASSLLSINEKLPFLVIIIGSIFMAILTRFLKTSSFSETHTQEISNRKIFSSRNFRYFLAIFILMSISLQLWLTSLPIFLSSWYKVSSYYTGYFIAGLGGVFALFQGIIFPYINKKFSSKQILYFLIFANIVLLFGLEIFNQNLVSLFICFALAHNFSTMGQTILQSQAFELFPKNSGAIGGILTSGASLVTAIIPLLGGYLVEFGGPIFGVCGFFSLLSFLVYLRQNRKLT